MPRLLYAGRFNIAALMDEIAAGRAPSNHLHGVPLLAAHGWQVRTLSLSAKELRNGRAFQARLWRERDSYDVVLTHSYYDLRWLALAKAAGLFRPHTAAFVHSLRPRSWDRLLMHGYSRLFVLSHAAAAAATAAGARVSQQVYFTYGADQAFYRELPWPASPGIVLSVGVSGRDFATLIRAARSIAAEVHIVGRVSAADVQGAPSNVHFHSSGNYDLPFAEMTALFARASCVVVTHHGSGHPYGLNAVVEAMAQGRPVVLTDGAGIDIDPAQLGFGVRVPVGHDVALATAVNRVMSDPAGARAMGRMARQRVDSVYNSAAMAACLDQGLRALGD